MQDRKKLSYLGIMGVFLVLYFFFGAHFVALAGDTVYEEWQNNRDTLGGEGAQHYLNKEVPLMHSVGGDKVEHWIIGQVTLVKNKIDHYCYVKINGKWYVHLQGYRAGDHKSTTGWFAEELVVESSNAQPSQVDHVPILEVEDVYMYLNTDIDMARVLKDAKATDEEDGNLQNKIVVQNQESLIKGIEEKKKLDLVKDEEYLLEIIYEVQDSAGNVVEERAMLHLYGIFENDEYLKRSKGYVRFISKKYLDTLEPDSVWKTTDMYTYLCRVLS